MNDKAQITDQDLHAKKLELQRSLKNASKDLRMAKSMLRHSPDNQSLKDDEEVALRSIASLETDLEDVQNELDSRERARRQEAARKERQHLIDASVQHEFTVPDDDPVIACQMLAAIAERLQYQLCSSQSYYEFVLGRVYTRRAGEDQGHNGDDMPVPELVRKDQDELDRLEKQRKYIQELRFAVERTFNVHADEIPADSTYRPQLLRQTDEQCMRRIEESKDRRNAEQEQARKNAAETARGYSRNDLSVYTPGQV